MAKQTIVAQKRNLLGRKVKQLRVQGLLPANIFGKKVKSQSVSVSLKDFSKIYQTAGETTLVEIDLEGKKLPVLISNVSFHPVSGLPLHADFHQVDLKEKVTANVPLEIMGEAPAVKDKIGVLLKNLDTLEVEALPENLPEKISIDVSQLKAIDESIKVSGLKAGDGVKILTDPDLELVKIAPLVSKEAEAMAKEEAEKQAAQAAQAAEATAAPQGEAPAAAPASETAKTPQQPPSSPKPKS